MCDVKKVDRLIANLELHKEEYQANNNTIALLSTYISLANLYDIKKDIVKDDEKDFLIQKIDICVTSAKKIESTLLETSGNGGSGGCKKFSPLIFSEGSEECKTWFNTIVGLSDVKKAFTDAFINPLKYPRLYGGVPKGLLLYGPPGVGKTAIVKAAINELQSQSDIKILFYAPTAGQLKGKYFGESEKSIRSLFECASKKACEETKEEKSKVISVIFLDEVEALASRRDKDSTGFMTTTVNALLTAIEGVESFPNVSVIAATNFPWNLDSAFLRRFSRQIYFDLPTSLDIYKLFATYLGIHFENLMKKDVTSFKKMCQNAAEKKKKGNDGRGCERPEKTIIEVWKTPEYAPFVRNLDEFKLRALSSECAKQHYSGSDINQLFKHTVVMAAEAAVKHNSFYTVDGKKGKYYSTLSMSEDMLRDVFKKNPSDFRYISIPETLYIDSDNRKEIYINKSIYPIVNIADDTIDDYFIRSGEMKNNEIDILLGFTVFIEQKGEKINNIEKYEKIKIHIQRLGLPIEKVILMNERDLINRFKFVWKDVPEEEKKLSAEVEIKDLIENLKTTIIPGLVIERKFFIHIQYTDDRYRITKAFSNGISDILRGGLNSLYKHGKEFIIKDWFTGEYKTYNFKTTDYRLLPTWMVSGPIVGLAKSKKVETTSNIFTYMFDALSSGSSDRKYHVHRNKPYNRLAVDYVIKGDLQSYEYIISHIDAVKQLLKQDSGKEEKEEKDGKEEKEEKKGEKEKKIIEDYETLKKLDKTLVQNFVNFDIRSEYFIKAKQVITSSARDEDIADMKKYETDKQAFLKEKV